MSARYETNAILTFEGWYTNIARGGCSACNGYITLDGVTPHRVAVFHVGILEIRMCSGCLKRFVQILGEVSP